MEKTYGKETFRFFARSKHHFEGISCLRHVLLSLMILESLPFITQNPIARYRYYQGVRWAYFIERYASRPSWDPLPPGPHGRSCCRDDAHPEAPKCRIESTEVDSVLWTVKRPSEGALKACLFYSGLTPMCRPRPVSPCGSYSDLKPAPVKAACISGAVNSPSSCRSVKCPTPCGVPIR
jgi:hypothetical protein